MAEWSVIFYRTAAGDSPIAEYLDNVGPAEAAKVGHDLALLRSRGLSLGFPQVSHIEGKIFELRVRGGQAHRILYFATSGQRFVLLSAFTKRTAKTPKREVEVARARMEDFERRHQKGEL